MASLAIAALPVQRAAPALLTATKMSPMSATYTAAVEDNLPPRLARIAGFKYCSRYWPKEQIDLVAITID
jgi:hypothetical protein